MNVAIVQDSIGGGGRIVVIIAMIEVLNKLSIIPDIVTFNFTLSEKEIEEKYGKKIRFRLKKIPVNLFRKLPEINILWINFLMRFYSKKYDLFIDSNNTTCLMPSNIKKILSYTYFPRKRRVLAKESIKLLSDRSFKAKIAAYFDNKIASFFYRRDYIKENTQIITLSDFSRRVICEEYSANTDNIQVVYPPVNITDFENNKKKKNSITSIGRFSPAKRQLEQLEIAKDLPDIKFNIIGFAEEDNAYFLKCKKYIEENGLKNVTLHRNISYDKLIEILTSSKYFLHTLENEPFGITTVQGIAAGCIPIVPDSGGQIEIVPVRELRFEYINEVVKIVNQIEKADFSLQLEKLKKHIRKYSENNFKENFKNIMNKLSKDLQ